MNKLNKLRAVVKNMKLAYSYVMDSDVSILNKGLAILPLIYIISPIDLVGDYLLGIGWLDDTLIAILIWGYMLKKLDKYRPNSNINSQDDDDVDYDFKDDEYDIE